MNDLMSSVSPVRGEPGRLGLWIRATRPLALLSSLIPCLGQYWHPWLLRGEAHGSAVLGGEQISLDGWNAYAEHTWGGAGFPPRWWWGQAQGFERGDLCVAFAGGDVTFGRARAQATSVVVSLGETLVRLGNPLLAPIHVEADGARWQVHGRGPCWSIELEGAAPAEAAHHLPVPLPAQRRSVPGAYEHLAADVKVVLRRRGRIIFAGESALAGLEIGGLDAALTPERQ